ncbi:MAG: sel1 repeat family protein, partial [Myxococcales bacterium]|nr:sel1 repeat family protein [Myxococcales bacterium]
GDCEGATHFVRSAIVGAFAVGTGTRGHAGTVAEVFKIGEVGGTSTSEQQSLNRDGDLLACQAANPKDEAPPPQCQSLLRVELVAIGEDADQTGADGEAPLGNVCTAAGYVWDGQKCVEEAKAKAFRCQAQDVAECREQCELGNADSCYNFGFLHVMGKVDGSTNRPAAKLAFEKACEGGSLAGCSSLAWQLDWKAEPERVEGLLAKSCEGGRRTDCHSLGTALLRGTLGKTDEVRGEKLLADSCRDKNPVACGDLATWYYETKKQAKRAADLLAGDCEGGSSSSCAKLGAWLSRCEDAVPPGMGDGKSCKKFPDTNANKATLAFESACRGKFYPACRTAGDRHGAGKGVSADAGKAHELYAIGCPYGSGSCEALGRTYEAGLGVAADLTKAYDAYSKGCDGVSKGDCFDAARVAKALGNQTDYIARLEKGCSKNSRRSCDELTKVLVKDKKKDEAKAVYLDVCTRLRDKGYCDAFTKLGGELPADFKAN